MNAITYRLRLLEPVLVSQAESGEENSAIGLSFVPGSVLRGAMAGRYLDQTAQRTLADPAADGAFRRLFLDGSVCFLNAYPWREGARMLPKPASWMTEKALADDAEGPVYDWALDPDRMLDHPKVPEGDFCLVKGTSATLAKVSRQINVHISLEQVNVRTDENTVYRYEALAAGEVLAGAVVSQDDGLLMTVRDLLAAGEISIGAAHGAGYGRTAIEAVSDKPIPWQEYTAEGDPNGKLIVTLLSDAILRGADGQIGHKSAAILAATLGLPIVEDTPSYHRLRLVGGYNRKWSLPLPQTWAVQAGSVFVCEAGEFDLAAIRRAAELGVGERRGEGFGRLAINWQTQPELRRRKLVSPDSVDIKLSSASRALAQEMANRRLRLLLERKLVEQVNAVTVKPRPKNAQLSRVRAAIQEALTQPVAENTQPMQPVLNHLKDLRGAREQFEKARIGGTTLLRWLQERAEKLDVQEQLLRGPVLPQVAGVTAQLDSTLRLEFTARLLDGVLKKAGKQNQQEVGG